MNFFYRQAPAFCQLIVCRRAIQIFQKKIFSYIFLCFSTHCQQISPASASLLIKILHTDADSSTDNKKILLVRQNSLKIIFFLRAIIHPLWAKVFKSETTSFNEFTPRIRKNLKSLDIGHREVGAKRCLNGVNKGEKNP